jgi:type I restriction enzyme S subunit
VNRPWLSANGNKYAYRKLIHVASLKARIGWQNLRAEDFVDEGPFCVTGTDFLNGKVNWSTAYHVSAERYEMDRNIQLAENDLLVTKDGTIGKVAVVDGLDSLATLNSGVFVVRPKTHELSTSFLGWVIRSKVFDDFVAYNSSGSTINHLYQNVFETLTFPFPDLPTQRAIADFLDRETARIDLLIEKKRRLAELLGEVFFSELERLTFSEKPLAAELIPFRWVCRIAEGQVDPTSDFWRGRILIAPNHIESKTGRLIETETAEDQGAISGKYSFSSGTVLYSKIRPALAKACISNVSGMCSADMYPIVPDKRLKSEYLLMQLLSARFTDWAAIESMRVAMPKINRETLGGFKLFVPSIELQTQSIERFSGFQFRFERATDSIKSSIDRLREYRSALITAAVTGQIDVTKWVKAGTADRKLDAVQATMNA